MKVAVLDDYQNAAAEAADWSRLKGVEPIFFSDHLVDHDELVARLSGFSCVVLMRERTGMPRSILERLPSLRLLVTTGAKNAAIDVAAATELGIQVCGTRSAVPPTIELTWALILAMLRNVAIEDRAVRAGRWQVSLGEGLHGKTLGILGLGRLGTMVARIGSAFGMRVIAWSQNLDAAHAASEGVIAVDHDTFFSTSDVISIHLILSERTRKLIGSAEFHRMKRSAYIVNTSRGDIVDERALAQALADRQIAGAGIDVFSEEPLPASSPLRMMDNVLLSPHKGYVTREAYELYYSDVVEAIGAWQNGAPVRPLNVL